MKNDIGIYQIVNTKTNKRYIGSSKALANRKYDHFGKLRHNTHHNTYLQNAYNKYGESAFIFDVLETLKPEDIDNLLNREQYYIDKYKFDDLYNIQKLANWSNKPPLKEERKKRLSILNKNEGNANSKLTNKQVKEIKQKLLKRQTEKDLAKEYNVSSATINQIKLGKIWSEISPELNEQISSLYRLNTPMISKEMESKIYLAKKMMSEGYTYQNIIDTTGLEIKLLQRVKLLNVYIYIGEEFNPKILELNKTVENVNKLSNEQIEEIKYLFTQGYNAKTLSEKFNVAENTISRIVQCKRHINIGSQYNEQLQNMRVTLRTKEEVEQILQHIRNGESSEVVRKLFNISVGLFHFYKKKVFH